jgi:hypothetical protein
MKLPDVTKIQIVAIAKAGIALALALSLPLSDATQAEIIGLAGAVATALVFADAIIRNGRSKIAANPDALAALEQPGKPANN